MVVSERRHFYSADLIARFQEDGAENFGQQSIVMPIDRTEMTPLQELNRNYNMSLDIQSLSEHQRLMSALVAVHSTQ